MLKHWGFWVTIIFAFALVAGAVILAEKAELEGGEFFPNNNVNNSDPVDALNITISAKTLFLKDEIISFSEERDGAPTGKKFAFTIAQLEAMREGILILLSGHLDQQEKVKTAGTTIPMRMIEDPETKEYRIETIKEYEIRRRNFLASWYAQLEREREILEILGKGFLEGDWK